MGLGTQSLKQLWDSSPQSGTVCDLARTALQLRGDPSWEEEEVVT